MAISEPYSNTATISTTEYSLVNNSTTLASITDDGVYQVFVDLFNLAVGDEYEIKIKEKVTSGGTQRTLYTAYQDGDIDEPFVTPSLILLHGWDVTMKKIAGTDRLISWSIRKVV